MFALGESIPVVRAESGWSDPKVALTVYAHAMGRDDAENAALRELVEGSPMRITGQDGAAGQQPAPSASQSASVSPESPTPYTIVRAGRERC
jgi:hypothetical protein